MGDFAVKLAFARVCRDRVFDYKYGVNFIHTLLISPSTETVPHLQRDLVISEGNCDKLPFYLFSFKACLNKLLFVFFVCIFRCYDRSRIYSSDMQYRRLSVWSVYFNFNTLSCQNYFFPEGMGGVHKTCGNSGGVGGLLLCSKNGNSGEEGGTCVNSLCGGGMDIFWNYTITVSSDPNPW